MKKLFTLMFALLMTSMGFAQIKCTLGGQSANGEYSWGWNPGTVIGLHFTSQWGEFNIATTGLTEGATYKLTVAEANENTQIKIYGATEAENQYIAIDKTEITGTIPAGVTKISIQGKEANQEVKIISFTINETQTAYSTNWGTAYFAGAFTSTGQYAELMINGVESFDSQIITVNANENIPEGLQLKVKYSDGTEGYPALTAGAKIATVKLEKAVKQVSLQAATATATTIDIASVTTYPYKDVEISPASGSINEALATALGNYNANNVTINLTAGAAYTVTAPIVAGGNVVINGAAGATIDVSGCVSGETPAPVILMSTTPAVEANASGAYVIDGLTIKDVKITGLKAQLIKVGAVKYLFNKVTIDNSVIEIKSGIQAKSVIDFSGAGGNYIELSVNKSTFWADAASKWQNGGFFSSQSSKKLGELGVDTSAEGFAQKTSITNSTFYNIAYGKTTSTLIQNSQSWMLYIVKNNVIVNSGKKEQFLKGLNSGQGGKATNWDVDGNIFNFDGANIVETTAGEVKNSIEGVITFTSTETPDFGGTFATTTAIETVTAGDPRWTITVSKLDATTLNASITEAEGLLEGKDVTVADSPEKTLNEAIAAAKAAKAKAKTQTEIDAANTTLQAAISAYKTATGIETISVDGAADIFADGKPVYNLAGQRVFKGYKGLVIKNGKKVVVK